MVCLAAMFGQMDKGKAQLNLVSTGEMIFRRLRRFSTGFFQRIRDTAI